MRLPAHCSNYLPATAHLRTVLTITLLLALSSLAIAQNARALASHSPANQPADWSAFRGPSGMGIAASKNLPTTVDESNVVWKTSLPGGGASSPIVFGDKIFLTSYTGYLVPDEPRGSLEQLKRHVLAIDRQDGVIRWNRAVAASLPEEERIRDHGYAANSLAADEDFVYAFLGKSGVYAFDHDGRQVWHANVGSKTSGWGTAASPVLVDDLVIINASVESESLVALDRKTGAERWRLPGIRESWNTPLLITVAGRQELVLARFGDVLAVDPKTGKQLWSCQTDITWYIVPSVVAAEGKVYLLGGRSGITRLAVRAGGNGDVTKTHRIWADKSGSNVTSPVYKDGLLFWMSDKAGIAYCAKADTGELLYEERLNRVGQVYASPILAGNRIYYLTRDGQTIVVAAEPEFREISRSSLRDGSRFDASPAVDGDRLLIRSEKSLYCISN